MQFQHPPMAIVRGEQMTTSIDTAPTGWMLEGQGRADHAGPAAHAHGPVLSAASTITHLPLPTRLRLLIALGSGALAFVQDVPLAIAGAALVAVAELAGARSWRLATSVQAVLAAVVVVTTTRQGSAALPLLLLAVFRAGDRGRPRDVLGVTGISAATLLAGWLPLHQYAETGRTLVSDAVVWLGLAAGFGMLQCLSLRRAAEQDMSGSERAAQEAAYLVYRLGRLAHRLPSGLHAPDVADELLDTVFASMVVDRAAVLVRRGDDVASPLVVRGSDRVPWRDPVRSPGAASVAWRTRATVTDVRPHDSDGRRRGSAMLCVPLLDADRDLIGLLVLERLTPVPFTAAEMACTERTVSRLAPHLQAALMFGDLQMVATTAEREQLAREMHDGIAQDLVALAFSLEALSRQLRKSNPDAEQAVMPVRAELARMVSDIRFSIADLRSSVRPEGGLGAALSSQVQSIASSTRLTMHLSLRESTFRLPAQTETALLRAAQSLLHDIRSDRTVSEIWLSLDVEPPRGELVIRHDGGPASHLHDELAHHMDQFGVAAVEITGELRLSTCPVERAAAPLGGEVRA
jgi:signal transduction histidine kinase